MTNTIRIKRRAVGGAAGAPASLAAAELAYNEQDDTLYYGKGNSAGAATTIVPIAGAAKADLASPTFTGDPKAPTPAPGDADTSIATTAFVANAVTASAAVVPVGQVYLSRSGANLQLARQDGTLLFIAGANRAVPSSPLLLPATGTANNTLYYIYAWLNAGVMTLEYSTTAWTVDTTYGIKVKNGDNTRTLVGIAFVTPAATWSAAALDVASYWCPRSVSDRSTATPAMTVNSSVLNVMTSNRPVSFVTFGDREVAGQVIGTLVNGDPNQDMGLNLAIDLVTAGAAVPAGNQFLAATMLARIYGGGNDQTVMNGRASRLLTEGRHRLTPAALNATGTTYTATWLPIWTEITIQG